jgi:hypothetical protein
MRPTYTRGGLCQLYNPGSFDLACPFEGQRESRLYQFTSLVPSGPGVKAMKLNSIATSLDDGLVSEWLDGTLERNEIPVSAKANAERAINEFQNMPFELPGDKMKEAYIKMLVGRGFTVEARAVPGHPAST